MSDSTCLENPRTIMRHSPGWRALAAAALALCALACSPPAPPGPPTVAADGERLTGACVVDGSAEAVFLGIPYAAPPVGDLRWKAPAPITPRPGVQSATDFAPACVQGTNQNSFLSYIAKTLGQDPTQVPVLSSVSEDCLYLNVWTPNLEGGDLAPVMVWIHGGDNVAGSAVGDDVRRRQPRPSGSGGGDHQLPPQRLRLPRPSGADRGIRARLVGQLRAARPDCRSSSGSSATSPPSEVTRAA